MWVAILAAARQSVERATVRNDSGNKRARPESDREPLGSKPNARKTERADCLGTGDNAGRAESTGVHRDW